MRIHGITLKEHLFTYIVDNFKIKHQKESKHTTPTIGESLEMMTILFVDNCTQETCCPFKAADTPALTRDLTAPRTYLFLAAPLTPSSIALLMVWPDER